MLSENKFNGMLTIALFVWIPRYGALYKNRIFLREMPIYQLSILSETYINKQKVKKSYF